MEKDGVPGKALPNAGGGGEGRAERWAGAFLLCLTLAYAAWMMSHALGGPFQRGYLGRNGARYALMARNVLRYSPAAAWFAPLLNVEGDPEPDPYLHHPPLLPYLLAIVFRVYRETEDAARLVPCLFTLGILVLLFFLGRRIFGRSLAGGVCAALAAALPMTGFYGAHVDVQGPPLLFCMLAALAAYLAWLDRGGRGRYLLSLAFLSLGILFDWPALYLAVLIPLHYALARAPPPRRLRAAVRALWPFPAAGGTLFLMLAAWLGFAARSKGTSLVESFLSRSVHPVAPVEIGSPLAYALRQFCSYSLPETHGLYPWPFLVLIAAGLLPWRREREGMDRTGKWTLRLLLAAGALHMVLFPFGVLFHDYWSFLLAPWAACAAARPLLRLAAGRTRGGWIVSAAFGLAAAAAGTVYTLDRYGRPPVQEPFLFGRIVHATVPPGEAVLTNVRDINPFVRNRRGDRYLFSQPAATYYADRVIRGGIATPDAFEAAVRRRRDFAWFAFSLRYREEDGALLRLLQDRYPLAKKVKGALFFFRLPGRGRGSSPER